MFLLLLDYILLTKLHVTNLMTRHTFQIEVMFIILGETFPLCIIQS